MRKTNNRIISNILSQCLINVEINTLVIKHFFTLSLTQLHYKCIAPYDSLNCQATLNIVPAI